VRKKEEERDENVFLQVKRKTRRKRKGEREIEILGLFSFHHK
jgi:hypothetical protein